MPRPIDVGMINGEAFLVMAGTGFDALMIRDADDAKERFGKLSYIRAGARHLDRAGARVKVKVDGERWFKGRAACVLVGNTGRILGGLQAFPDARFDDGRLDVGCHDRPEPDGLDACRRAGGDSAASTPRRSCDITQGSRVKVQLDHEMPWQLDGGDRPPAKKFDVSVLPGRIPIWWPAS